MHVSNCFKTVFKTLISNLAGVKYGLSPLYRCTTTTKPYPIKWGQPHRSNYAIVFYDKPYLDQTH